MEEAMVQISRRIFERLERFAQRNLGKGYVQPIALEVRDALQLWEPTNSV